MDWMNWKTWTAVAVILIAVFFVKALGTSTAQQRGET